MIRFNQTSGVTVVTPTNRHKSVRIVFVAIFMLSRCFSDFSVGVGTFVIGLSRISSFFSLINYIIFTSIRYLLHASGHGLCSL